MIPPTWYKCMMIYFHLILVNTDIVNSKLLASENCSLVLVLHVRLLIHIRENRRDNQEQTFQRHWQHRTDKIHDKDKQSKCMCKS